jgi:hypothetical protein
MRFMFVVTYPSVGKSRPIISKLGHKNTWTSAGMKGVKTLDRRILNLLRQSAAADRSNHDISGNYLKKESRQIKFSS